MDSEDFQHRGRIQAQGDGLEESVSWSQDLPITAKDSLKLLEELKNKIPKHELKRRKQAFDKAEKFVLRVEENNGVDAPVSKTFKIKDTKDVRVDIEVIKGKAFISSIIIIFVSISLWIYLS
ncbi:MAG: hypothetical protein KDK90_27435 [Leptospiraceae bacterium]|nr:hypothetical protein [Leptospiraceae bacterium]